MKVFRIEDMIGGWFVGNFEPSAFKADFEVAYKFHAKGEKVDFHWHTKVTEINMMLSGKMKFQDRVLEKGDIFVVNPYSVADPEFLEDCELIVVKTPSINDKVLFDIKE